MTPVSGKRANEIRRRQHATRVVRDALQELRRQLARLNYRVGSGLGLKDVDLDCLDIISAYGANVAIRAGTRRRATSRRR